MNDSVLLKQFLKDKAVFSSFFASIVLWLIAFSFAYIELFPLQKGIILHLNLEREVDIIGTAGDISSVLVGVALLALINGAIGYFFYRREKLLSYLFALMPLWITVMALVMVYALTVIN